MKGNLGDKPLNKYSCKYRLLYSFETFAEYNYPRYPFNITGVKTYYYTHDNSFLEIVMNNVRNHCSLANKPKKDRALFYAKQLSILNKVSERFLKIVSEHFEIHTTCEVDVHTNIFADYNIQNHGPVSSAKVQELLSESKLFIVISTLYDGPGPLEAMAAGAVYLQSNIEKNKRIEGFTR